MTFGDADFVGVPWELIVKKVSLGTGCKIVQGRERIRRRIAFIPARPYEAVSNNTWWEDVQAQGFCRRYWDHFRNP